MPSRLLRIALLLVLAGGVATSATVRGSSAARADEQPPPAETSTEPTVTTPPPATAPTTTTTPATTTPAPAEKGVELVVTVLDGDRRLRVRGARVRLAGHSKRTNRDGVATVVVPHRRHAFTVSIAAKGFQTRTLLVHFELKRKQTLRIYRPDLQWPMYGVDNSRTQAQPHIKLRPPFRTVWSLNMGGLIEFPAVVDDGVAYIGNAKGQVRAISMRFGKVIWRHDTPGHPRMASSPAVAGTEVVYHTMDGHVDVLRQANGHPLWSYDAGSPIESSPIVHDGVDYFGAWNGRVSALDLKTHKLRWTRTLGAKITSSAAIVGGTLYIGDYSGRLWALSARTGATRWVGQVNGRIYGTPAVANGRIFVPSSTGYSLTAFSTRGARLWTVRAGGYVYSSPAVASGRVFFGSYDGSFYGVSAATGRLLWRVYAGGPISGAAVVVDGIAYAGSFARRILGVNAATGKTVLTYRHGDYVPVSGNGMRLLFHGYSRLYAVEPRTAGRKAVTRITASSSNSSRRPGK
ncbi:MAG TPA: PQQ-binding-like beta-propeller repeat protein [Gaiellaceae bacterium]|nr:PQQ-binding-like beta-propeller repeat protein [Gaiellaceae bacterium]